MGTATAMLSRKRMESSRDSVILRLAKSIRWWISKRMRRKQKKVCVAQTAKSVRYSIAEGRMTGLSAVLSKSIHMAS